LTCSELAVIKKEDKEEWDVFIPQFNVKNLRLSLLRKKKISLPIYLKNFLIRHIQIWNFQGELGEVKTWKGEGEFCFSNPSSQQVIHPLLAIPAEVALRLGLNPNVLTPITGSIYFNIQEERFYLKKFKDVFSIGKGSKFYLAHKKSSSWIDFQGNLSIQIRMRQYNLIFKIAELFTVSIQGNLKNPVYGFQKYSK
jgi:hypothetical protein